MLEIKLFSLTFKQTVNDVEKLIFEDQEGYFYIQYNKLHCNPKMNIWARRDNEEIIRYYNDIEEDLIQEQLNNNLGMIYSSFKAYEKHKQNQANYVKRLLDLYVEKYNILL